MKRIIVILSILFGSISAHSQILISLLLGDKLNSDNVEFGLDGGVTYSNVGGFSNDGGLAKFQLGFYFNIRMKDNIYLHTGLQGLTNPGMSKLSDSDLQILNVQKLDYPGKYSEVINAFYIPILAQYRFKNFIYLEAGPQLGWLYNSFARFTSDYDNRDISIKENNRKLLNWFDAGLTVGGGYRLMKGKGWSVGMRYYQGLTNAFDGVPNSRNNVLYFICKVPIGASPKDKNKGQPGSSD